MKKLLIFLALFSTGESTEFFLRESRVDSLSSIREKNQAITGLVEKYTESWKNILHCLSKMKDKESLEKNKEELKSEFARIDSIAYRINRIPSIENSSDVALLRSLFSQNKNVLNKVEDEYKRLEANDFFGEKKHFAFFEKGNKKGRYPAVSNRRGVYSPILGTEDSDGKFLDNVNASEKQIYNQCNQIASAIMHMEDVLRNITRENVDKFIPEIKKQADFLYSISSDVHYFCGRRYKDGENELKSYMMKRIASLDNDMFDQYIILRNENFLGSEKLKKELSFFEINYINGSYKHSMGNTFEKEWKARLSILKMAQKGKFYSPIKPAEATQKE